MNKTLKKLTILVVVSLAVIGGILGGLSATATAQTADEDAIKAEVEAAADIFEQAINTSDGDLFDSMWLQSDETTYISANSPFRIDGWTDVRAHFAGPLSLPPGSASLIVRQLRVDVFGDDMAVATSHYIFSVRAPAPPATSNGRATFVYQKVDGKMLIVSGHTSHLPE